MNKKQDLQKIHATVSIVVGLIIVGMCVYRLFRIGKEGIPMVLASLAIGAVLLAFMNLYKGLDTLKKYLMGFVVFFFVILLFISNGFSIQYHYLLMSALSIVVIYFDPKLFRNYSIVVAIVLLPVYVIFPEKILGAAHGNFVLAVIYITLLVIMTILYLLTKWGAQNLRTAEYQSEEAKKSNDNLQNIIQKISRSASIIDDSVKSTSDNMDNIRTSQVEIMDSVGTMKQNVNEQVTFTGQIELNLNESMSKIEKIKENSNELIEVSENTNRYIEISVDKMEEVYDKMDVIYQSSQTSVEYVHELSEKIKLVDELLSRIQSVASQTNMLALNASIEAARAGEQGKGFAVVAENIGVLAHESSKIVERINEVSMDMSKQSHMVMEQVSQEMNITKEGNELIHEVQEHFKTLQDSMKQSNTKIVQEIDDMEQIIDAYESVQKNITNLSEIIHSNVDDVNLIADEVKIQEKQIQEISSQMYDIAQEGAELAAYKVI